MSDAIKELTDLLSRLPGIGKRTAQRLTFHLLKSNAEYVDHLGTAISTILQKVTQCGTCRNLSETNPCSICSNRHRDEHAICVVESVPDLLAIEETGLYQGRYFVLHGLLRPLDGVGPDDLQVDLLRRQIVERGETEVIIATRPSVEGEATAILIGQTLEGLPVRLSRIASGIPHGGELEYTDRFTLGRAMTDRREIK